MKSRSTVVSRLVFPAAARGDVIDTLLSLPGDLRPTHHRIGERERRQPIGDPVAFRDWKLTKGSFFLLAPQATYDLDIDPPYLPAVCAGYKMQASLAKEYLAHMAGAGPLFGYCCANEEEEHRHWLVMKLPDGGLRAYYGWNIDKYVPGLYWQTLVSDGLLEKHDIPLSILDEIALERTDLGRGLHLFRFHEKPEDWRANTAIDKAFDAAPGFFDLQKVRSQLTPTDDHRDLLRQLEPWD
jgi:hypothetical protein